MKKQKECKHKWIFYTGARDICNCEVLVYRCLKCGKQEERQEKDSLK